MKGENEIKAKIESFELSRYGTTDDLIWQRALRWVLEPSERILFDRNGTEIKMGCWCQVYSPTGEKQWSGEVLGMNREKYTAEFFSGYGPLSVPVKQLEVMQR